MTGPGHVARMEQTRCVEGIGGGAAKRPLTGHSRCVE
jgi:hypothetical protein